MQECIPKGVLPKRRHVPWITKQIRSAIHKRNLLYGKSQISGSTSLFIKYRIARNKVATMLKREKQSYMQGLGITNAKHFWKAVKILTGKSYSIIPTLNYLWENS